MKRLSLAFLFALSVFVGCSSNDSTSSNTVAAIIARTNNLSTLETALNTADLTDLFADPNGEYTIFAPTDEAFAAFGALPEGDTLAQVLYYHSLSEELISTDLRSRAPGTLETIEGSPITLKVEGDRIFLNDTTELITTDLEASNGVVHIINKVLTIPPATQ
jgi:transforming growth factor-beta-induced protein